MTKSSVGPLEKNSLKKDAAGSLATEKSRESRYTRQSGKIDNVQPFDKRTTTERDRGRVGYSSYLRRLAGVTQVVTPSLENPRQHTRESHSHKVALIAREIAEHLARVAESDLNGEVAEVIGHYGGLDIPAAETAGLAHDLGHPPFGHGGEVALNRALRDNGVVDGFEGNAQSFRIVTRLDKLKQGGQHGLDLSLVTLAAVLKYPRLCPDESLASGKNSEKALTKPPKFGAYLDDKNTFENVIGLHPRGSRGYRQTLEAAVMDLADDVAYASHDLEDFYKERIIDFSAVRRDFSDVNDRRGSWTQESWLESEDNFFLRIAKDLEETYVDYFDRTEYANAVNWVDSMIFTTYPLTEEFDGSAARSARVSELVGTIMRSVFKGLQVSISPRWENGPSVFLDEENWHRIQVLKTITRRYVVDTRRMGMVERSQSIIVTSLFNSLKEWLKSKPRIEQLPEPLGSFLRETTPLDGNPTPAQYRAIADYLCTMSDSECLARSRWLSGGEVPSIALAR